MDQHEARRLEKAMEFGRTYGVHRELGTKLEDVVDSTTAIDFAKLEHKLLAAHLGRTEFYDHNAILRARFANHTNDDLLKLQKEAIGLEQYRAAMEIERRKEEEKQDDRDLV